MSESFGTVARIVKPSDSQADCVLIGLDDSVELHRRVPILRRDFEDAAGQGTSDTLPAAVGDTMKPALAT